MRKRRIPEAEVSGIANGVALDFAKLPEKRNELFPDAGTGLLFPVQRFVEHGEVPKSRCQFFKHRVLEELNPSLNTQCVRPGQASTGEAVEKVEVSIFEQSQRLNTQTAAGSNPLGQRIQLRSTKPSEAGFAIWSTSEART